MGWLLPLALLLYTILSGAQQGIITWLCTEYVPPARADWINAALHTGGGLIYALLVALAVQAAGPWGWLAVAHWAALAVLLRVAAFDPALNAARAWFDHREGRPAGPLFAVGSSAWSDKLLRRLAPHRPERLSLALRVAALAGVAGLLL